MNAVQDQVTWYIPLQPFDLTETIESGQTFCWERTEEGYGGWIDHCPVRVRVVPGGIEVTGSGMTQEAVRNYFAVDFPWQKALDSFPPDDPWIAQALAAYPGLRLLHQPAWETLACFICSAAKQIQQIKQINQALRRRFGTEVSPGQWTFPSPETVASVGESGLRGCQLGFRAPYLAKVAERWAEGRFSFDSLRTLGTAEARASLCELPGVGEKIADCVLLFAGRRYEVFPVDVWVERVVRELYFPSSAPIHRREVIEFVRTYFGPYGGLAQQYLFHWIRHRQRNRTGKSRTDANRRR